MMMTGLLKVFKSICVSIVLGIKNIWSLVWAEAGVF